MVTDCAIRLESVVNCSMYNSGVTGDCRRCFTAIRTFKKTIFLKYHYHVLDKIDPEIYEISN